MRLFFRGQTRQKGQKLKMSGEPLPSEWVYGCGAFQGSGSYSIIYGGTGEDSLGKFSVYTETLCQYIGIDDKDGVEIFTEDIIKIDGIDRKWLVHYAPERYQLMLVATDDHTCELSITGMISERVQVIGNIFDNLVMVEDPEVRMLRPVV